MALIVRRSKGEALRIENKDTGQSLKIKVHHVGGKSGRVELAVCDDARHFEVYREDETPAEPPNPG